MKNPLAGIIQKMWRGERTGPEGSAQMAWGLGEWGGTYEIPFGDGFQRNLRGQANGRTLIATACVNAYVSALGACGVEHLRTKENGEQEVVTDSWVARVLRYPNFLQHQTQFLGYVVSSIGHTGNAYVYANQRNGRNEITSMMPLTPTSNRAVLSPDGSEVWYDVSANREFFTAGNTDVLVPARDVAHCKLTSHRSLLYGETPLADAGYTLALNNHLMASSSEFIRNMARPSGIISVEAQLSGAQMTELRTKFNEFSSGPNAGKVPILGNGAKWQPLTISAGDAQVMQLYNMTVIDICRAYRIPPQLLGMENNGAAANVEILINQWRASGLLYFAETIERTFERLFMLPADEEIRFDLDNIARADTKTLFDTLAVGVQNGLLAPNEARSRIGKGPVPFGDSPRVQAQNVRLQDAVPAASAPAAPVAGGTPSDPPDDTTPDPDEADDSSKQLLNRVEELQTMIKGIIDNADKAEPKLDDEDSALLAYTALKKAMETV